MSRFIFSKYDHYLFIDLKPFFVFLIWNNDFDALSASENV